MEWNVGTPPAAGQVGLGKTTAPGENPRKVRARGEREQDGEEEGDPKGQALLQGE